MEDKLRMVEKILVKWQSLLVLGLLTILTWGVYSGVQQCAFVGFDDDLYVYENPHVAEGLTAEGVRWAFSAVHASTWQPLVWLSYMADAELYGVQAGGYHRTNLWLHLLSVGLVYLVWRALSGTRWRAAGIAAMLALHPVHVESVAWVAERKDVLCAVFWWAAILSYVGYAHRGQARFAVAVVFFFLCALMSKPMALTLPAVLLLLDVWPLGRFMGRGRRCLLEKLCLLPLSLGSVVLTYYAQATGGSVLGVEVISLWGRLSNAIVSIGRYVGKLLWPSRLSLLYPHPGGWGVGAAVLVLVLLGVLVWIGFGWCWFIGTLIPVLGLVQIGWHAMADRFLYIPAVGLYAAVFLGAPELRRPVARGAVVGLFVLWLGTLSVVTSRQVARWQDNITLFSHAVSVTRGNWVMENCLGAALVRRGRVDEALPHLARAIAVNPERPKAYYNLGCAYMALGRSAEAADQFALALDRWPGNLKTQYNLAVARGMAGEDAEAIKIYEALLLREPGHVQAMNNLAGLYRRRGELARAIELLRRAVLVSPDYQAGRYNLGVFLLESGDHSEAARTLAELLRDAPGHQEAKEALRVALSRLPVPDR